MKAVILAGGRGTRISEESQSRPKPMVEIGGRPMLWHIMKIYGAAGITDFVILLGYKGYMIKEYFANYFLHMSDVTIDLSTSAIEVHQSSSEPWRVTLLDTGAETMTGGRLLQARRHIDEDPFCFTYGDGVADLDVRKVIAAHEADGALLTVTAVQPPGRYGTLTVGEGPTQFREKPEGSGGWVNGGFFVASPKILDYIEGDETVFERTPLERLSADGQLRAYQHGGFWHGMDTLWDKIYLDGLWERGVAPWKMWAD
ncbi:MAG: glucose-1-phosphate cytidylyltransferase [Ilumatobacteraceae bacterium]